MVVATQKPAVSAGVLVTVAFLKAQLDAGSDHLEMFMPLVLDVASRLPPAGFTVDDIQQALSTIHSVSMPKHVIATLIRKAERKLYFSKEIASYRWNPRVEIPISSVDAKKQRIKLGQRQLAESLMSHALRRKLTIPSVDAALEMLFAFLESEQIALLLDTPTKDAGTTKLGDRERSTVAEFIEGLVLNDSGLLGVLRAMLEGLVLYHAAFLPDLNVATRRFRSLRVIFDSPLLRQALGFDGPALKALLNEAIEVLKASGVECIVFEDTLEEIRRILAMFESRLGTTRGRADLKSNPTTRHFLTQRYGPSDMVEFSAFLERDSAAAGFRILARPQRENEFTRGEKELAVRLKRPNAGPELDMEPRVVHDVECIAGVLTLRRGRRSNILEEAGVVFATDSGTVIKTVQTWWWEDEKETSVPPIVHIRALTNLAWLKKPALCADFKIQELVALCASALQPQPATWDRFRRHLTKLQQSQRITSDEAAAVLVSDMLDRELKIAELESDDPDEIDAETLDDAVTRVIASYAAESRRKVNAAEQEKAAKVADAASQMQKAIERADAAERSTAEAARKRALNIQARARNWAHTTSELIRWCGNFVLVLGAASLVWEHNFRPGVFEVIGACCLIMFVFLEFVAIKTHVSRWLGKLEGSLYERFLVFLGIDD